MGYATTGDMRALFDYLRSRCAAPSAWCSARIATTTSAWAWQIRFRDRGGARQVECTISNGIGERASSAAMEELAVMALKVRGAYYGADTGLDTHKLLATSRLLSRITGMQVQRNKAITSA